jgi:hypothetical protein
MSVFKKFRDLMGIHEIEYDDYDTHLSEFSMHNISVDPMHKISSMPYSHVHEGMIDNIFLDLHASDLRIQKYQEEIDSLRVETKEMIANLTSLIK